MPKDDCRVNTAHNFAAFPQKTLSIFDSVHLQGTLQESGLLWLKYCNAEAESGCLGALLSTRQGGQGHLETQQSSMEKPCGHGRPLPQWGCSGGEQSISQSLESMWQVMKIGCWEQERASLHQPPPLIWERDWALVAAPKPGVSRELLVSCCVPVSKHFSGASVFISVGGTTLPTSSAHHQRSPQAGVAPAPWQLSQKKTP